jgi:hypothetical protein
MGASAGSAGSATAATFGSVRRVVAVVGLVSAAAVLAVSLIGSSVRSAAAAAADGPGCARTTGSPQQPTPTSGDPCWIEVTPYPFGNDGNPVDLSSPRCRVQPSPCAELPVTSFAFRAWNRGLAATSSAVPGGSNPYGVWLFNGTRWFPDPTFPGSKTCPGSTVLWAGKLDYWLIGTGPGNWGNLCRFDGSAYLWQPLSVPDATLARGKLLDHQLNHGSPGNTGITSGTCISWDNCWFFGTYGTILHWDGTALTDESPDVNAKPWLGTEFTDASMRLDTTGSPFGVAVGSSNLGGARTGSALPAQPGGAAPPQLYTAGASGWTPTPFTPSTSPQPGDPFRTDLVSVDLLPSGHGWAAGDPAGRRPGDFSPLGRTPVASFEPSPLIPLSALGSDPGCAGPPPSRFGYAPGQESYLWSSVAAVPGSTDSIAGGQFFPAGSSIGEPVIVDATCSGQATVTRFVVAQSNGATPPANGRGWIQAVAANAPNDAWAATSVGTLTLNNDQPPRIYHLTNGQPPQAPAGDDNEVRPVKLQLDPPIIVFAPPPPAPAEPPAVVTSSTTQTLPPAIAKVHTKVVRKFEHKKVRGRFEAIEKFTLNLTFTVSRPVTIGLVALRKNRVVATAPLKQFRPGSGKLQLQLKRKSWPTKLRFLTDTPTATLADPGSILSGTVTLHASASAISGRTVSSVRFEYAPSGSQTWTAIGTATSKPFATQFDTSQVAQGAYDLRAVVTDSQGVSGISPVVKARRIQNGPGG